MVVDAFWLPLLLKVAATVTVVVAASVAVERAGPFWGGLLCAFPLSAGPAYVLLALQTDPAFVAASALNSLAGNVGTSVFLLVIARLALRWPMVPTLAIAIAIWVVTILLVRQVAWSAGTAIAANVVAMALAGLWSRGLQAIGVLSAVRRRWLDLPVRALLIGLAVATIVTVSRAIGPDLTGIALVFPIALGSFAVVIHTRLGGRATAATMASAIRALPGFAAALLTLHLLAASGVWRALLAALGASLVYVIAMSLWRAYGRPALSGAV